MFSKKHNRLNAYLNPTFTFPYIFSFLIFLVLSLPLFWPFLSFPFSSLHILFHCIVLSVDHSWIYTHLFSDDIVHFISYCTVFYHWFDPLFYNRVCHYAKGLLISSSSSGNMKSLITKHLPFLFFSISVIFRFFSACKDCQKYIYF